MMMHPDRARFLQRSSISDVRISSSVRRTRPVYASRTVISILIQTRLNLATFAYNHVIKSFASLISRDINRIAVKSQKLAFHT